MVSFRYRKQVAAALAAVSLLGADPAMAERAFAQNDAGLGELFGFSADDSANITLSPQELQSLGCLITGLGIGAAAILFGGAAIIVTRGQGAAAATTIAVPVLATAMFAGCSVGAQAAPGVAWLRRNGDVLFGKMVNAIPAEPLAKVLPGQH